MGNSFQKFLKKQATESRLLVQARKLTSKDFKDLGRFVADNSTLHELVIRSVRITPKRLRPLLSAITKTQTLESLSFEHCGINDSMAMQIATAVAKSLSIKQLTLSHNRIREEGATALADLLKSSCALERLILSFNEIGDAGGEAFARVLACTATLRTLDLQHNQLGSRSGWALAETLLTNRTLSDLYLAGNQIGDAGARALCDMLIQNLHIQNVSMGGNTYGNSLRQEILAVLAKRATLFARQNDVRVDMKFAAAAAATAAVPLGGYSQPLSMDTLGSDPSVDTKLDKRRPRDSLSRRVHAEGESLPGAGAAAAAAAAAGSRAGGGGGGTTVVSGRSSPVMHVESALIKPLLAHSESSPVVVTSPQPTHQYSAVEPRRALAARLAQFDLLQVRTVSSDSLSSSALLPGSWRTGTPNTTRSPASVDTFSGYSTHSSAAVPRKQARRSPADAVGRLDQPQTVGEVTTRRVLQHVLQALDTALGSEPGSVRSTPLSGFAMRSVLNAKLPMLAQDKSPAAVVTEAKPSAAALGKPSVAE